MRHAVHVASDNSISIMSAVTSLVAFHAMEENKWRSVILLLLTDATRDI
jgi:hypothetical protein